MIFEQLGVKRGWFLCGWLECVADSNTVYLEAPLREGAFFEAMNIYVIAQTATVWVINGFCGCAERYDL